MNGERDRPATAQRAARPAAARAGTLRDPALRSELRAILAGKQESSWIRLPTAASAEPVLVARIHFATRDTTVDARDDDLLRQLACAYAAHATRNVGTPGAELGLVGQVVGHADPRPALEPDNDRLSEQRAFWVAQRLVRHLVQATGLEVSCFRIDWSGAGVTRPVAAEDEAAAGEDTMAALRFADVLLAGEAIAAGDTAPVAPGPESQPPKLKPWPPPSDVPRYEEAIRAGDARGIRDMARWMKYVVGDLQPRLSSIDELIGSKIAREVGPVIGERKPPWWDGRAAGIGASQGRNAARNELVAKAALLLRDWVETMKWDELHAPQHRGSSSLLLVEEVRKDKPDTAKVEMYMRNLEYLNFMLRATGDLAEEVVRLSER